LTKPAVWGSCKIKKPSAFGMKIEKMTRASQNPVLSARKILVFRFRFMPGKFNPNQAVCKKMADSYSIHGISFKGSEF